MAAGYKMAGKLAQLDGSECQCVMEFSRIYHDEINEVADFKFVAR